LVAAGRSAEAQECSARAVALYEELAAADPSAHLPGLSAVLDNHAHRLADDRQWDEALAYSARAVALRERLARINPDAYLPELARTLTNHANRLHEMGRLAEAVEFSGSAVELREQLYEANAHSNLADLAHATRNHANLLRRNEKWASAEVYSGRAVELFGTLAESHPRAFRTDLAAALGVRALILAQSGRAPAEALRLSGRVVDLHRSLVDRPESLSADDVAWSTTSSPFAPVPRPEGEGREALAHGLWIFALVRLTVADELTQALAAAEESCATYREVLDRGPATVVDELYRAEMTRADILDALGDADRADQVLADLAQLRASLPRRS
jgi:tetratricopeptide (TPR) repeat protein